MGRPRAFDRDKALDQALHLFWEKGYEGTSIADLTGAMGINPPSLYAAFGNKEALFRAALDRYENFRDQIMEEAFAAPTAREAMTRLLEGTADRLSDKDKPKGCLMVQGALSCGEAADPIRQELISRRVECQDKLCKRLERALVEGDLPAGSPGVRNARRSNTTSPRAAPAARCSAASA